MESKNEAEKWAAKYQISQFIHDETEEGFAPESVLIWDKKKVWTLWDESGEIGAFVQPGLEETGIFFSTDYFVVGWFLGLKKSSNNDDHVQILEREACESCGTDGCRECGDMGWIESNLLSSIQDSIQGL